jgi:hypothetical protein
MRCYYSYWCNFVWDATAQAILYAVSLSFNVFWCIDKRSWSEFGTSKKYNDDKKSWLYWHVPMSLLSHSYSKFFFSYQNNTFMSPWVWGPVDCWWHVVENNHKNKKLRCLVQLWLDFVELCGPNTTKGIDESIRGPDWMDTNIATYSRYVRTCNTPVESTESQGRPKNYY